MDNSARSTTIIEFSDATAGIVVREQRSYRFYAVDWEFRSLEGRLFGSASQAEAAARQLIRKPANRRFAVVR